jgi:hypothetical protein
MGKLNRISRSIDVTKKSNIFRLLEEGQVRCQIFEISQTKPRK